MKEIHCKHCGGKVVAEDEICPHCGIPLPPDHAKSSRKTFIIFFILLALFSTMAMLLLPLFD